MGKGFSSGVGTSIETTEITDKAVTLAKMADLAQDLFIGRTTASTGVPETATITAAARTVLDDTTVGAMVDTLGGAATTGTGGLARASSPTFVTPALGTPASGTLTNCTGLPVAGVAASTSTALGVGSIELGHATDTTLSRVSAGVVAVEGVTLVDLSSAQTLTTKTLTSPVINTQITGTAVGTGASQVAAGDHTHAAAASLVFTYTTDYSVSARLGASGVTSGGVVTFGTYGVQLETSATISSGARVDWKVENASGDYRVNSPTIGFHVAVTTVGTDFNIFLRASDGGQSTGGAITFTTDHFGFKMTRAASGTASLYATQGNGTTETASAALDTVDANDEYELLATLNGASSVDYYWQVNAGARSAATNLTGTMPVGTYTNSYVNISNVGVATATTIQLGHAMVQR